MATAAKDALPFSARYSLPSQVSNNLGEVSWETVSELSVDFQVDIKEKRGKVKKLLKELQMSRLLLLDRIKHGMKSGRADPKLLVDIVRLIQRCEKIARQYDIDLNQFSTFLYLVSEKLKKEKLAKHKGIGDIGCVVPIKEELSSFKSRSEVSRKKTRKRKSRKKRKRRKR